MIWYATFRSYKDFLTGFFFNLQGCTKGLHSNVKPPEPVKEEKSNSNKDEVAKTQITCVLTSCERTSFTDH